MLAAGKRADGRWEYGESPNSEISYGRRAVVGVIADHAPDLLPPTRTGRTTCGKANP